MIQADKQVLEFKEQVLRLARDEEGRQLLKSLEALEQTVSAARRGMAGLQERQKEIEEKIRAIYKRLGIEERGPEEVGAQVLPETARRNEGT